MAAVSLLRVPERPCDHVRLGSAQVIDAQMLFPLAKGLKKYIAGLGKPLKQIILSHNHPDHWFGAEILEDMAPIVSSANIINDLKTGGMRYIKIMSKNKKLEGKIPSRAIVPSGELKLGAQNWDGLDVIVEEHPDQESHHSLLIKVPAYGIMIGQDLFYNDRFLVASERSRNKNWQTLLENLRDNESKDKYKTLLVGHGNNGGPEILDEDIEYLKTLEAVLAQGLTQAETKQAMFKKYPNKGGKNFIDISLRNLFSKH